MILETSFAYVGGSSAAAITGASASNENNPANLVFFMISTPAIANTKCRFNALAMSLKEEVGVLLPVPLCLFQVNFGITLSSYFATHTVPFADIGQFFGAKMLQIVEPGNSLKQVRAPGMLVREPSGALCRSAAWTNCSN